MPNFYKIWLAGLTALLLGLPLIGAEAPQKDGELDRIFYTGYRSDGMFVSVPADAGNCLGLVIGAVPAALAAGTVHLFSGPDYQAMEAASVTVRCFTYPCGFILGVPFKFLKVVFWDGPSLFWGDLKKDAAKPYNFTAEDSSK